MTTSHADAATRYPTATIEAVPDLPVLRITRDFAATPAQLVRAHTDPDLFLEWAGPADVVGEVDHWDARTGGSYRYVHYRREAPEERYAFHGCFHEVGAHRLVQTFEFEGLPGHVSLDTMTLADLGDGTTRMQVTSVFQSFEDRDGMLASGMEVGISEGYAALDGLLAAGRI